MRNLLGSGLSKALDSKDPLEDAKRVAEQKGKELAHAREDVQTKLEGLGEPIAVMDSQTGQKLLDLRLRTGNQLRQLADTVVVFPVGLIPDILDRARKNIDDNYVRVNDLHPESGPHQGIRLMDLPDQTGPVPFDSP